MKSTTAYFLATLAALALSQSAQASDNHHWFERKPSCQTPREEWIPEAQLRQNLESQGFQVERVKLNKRHCLEAKVRNRQGYRQELILNPKDGQVLQHH